MAMNDDLTSIQDQVREGVAKALTPEALEELRVQILGRKGSLTQVMHQMGKLDPEERPIMGKMANDVRAQVVAAIEKRKIEITKEVLRSRLAPSI